jgi:hypothetical protein
MGKAKSITRTKTVPPKPKPQPRVKKRLRLLVTRDKTGRQGIILWAVGCAVKADKQGNYHAVSPHNNDDLIALSEQLFQAMWGFVPKPGAKLGVKLVKHRWRN